MNIAVIIILATFVGALLLGLRARRGVEMSLEQWTVGGRGFGSLLVFILMAGEIYTTFTFLGASGFAYQKCGVSLYIIAYICLAFVSSYWLPPSIAEINPGVAALAANLIVALLVSALARKPISGTVSG